MRFLDEATRNDINSYLEYLCANSTYEKPLWNKEVLIGLKKPGWNYIDGCMLVGLMNLYEESQDEKLLNYIENYVSPLIDENGHVKIYYYNNYNQYTETGHDSDPCNEAKILFNLYKKTKNEKYFKAIQFMHQ